MSERLQACQCNKPTTDSSFSNHSKLLDKNRKPLVSRPPLIQTKLTINQPGDEYEQEADRVAEQVMRMPDPASVPQSQVNSRPEGLSIQSITRYPEKDIQRKEDDEEDEEEGIVQMKQGSPSYTAAASKSAPPIVHEVLSSPGLPLDQATRAFMEPRFGHDLSRVRVHSDQIAEQSAREINALAYTVGHNIVFGAGRFMPETCAGRSLLAHELVHTFQQIGVSAPQIRRKIGDGHDLTSPRFAGDMVLEAIYDNERVLKPGDKGAAVKKLQQALLDAGYSLPRLGVNGDFGSETTVAVMDFQRASGLQVRIKGIDGIVDATTMGWLDQRFSAGPTPRGTTPEATPGCPNFKRVNVDIVSLDGSTRSGSSILDLERANSIFNQCCVRFTLTGGGSESPDRTRDLLGGDTVLHRNPRVGNPTKEEIAMFKGAADDFILSGRIRVFYVGSITPSSTPFGHTDAYSVPPSAATGSGVAVRNMVVITNTGSARTLAHEFGHILLNQGERDHYDEEGNYLDSVYLMSPAGPIPGERITPAQCITIFDNA